MKLCGELLPGVSTAVSCRSCPSPSGPRSVRADTTARSPARSSATRTFEMQARLATCSAPALSRASESGGVFSYIRAIQGSARSAFLSRPQELFVAQRRGGDAPTSVRWRRAEAGAFRPRAPDSECARHLPKSQGTPGVLSPTGDVTKSRFVRCHVAAFGGHHPGTSRIPRRPQADVCPGRRLPERSGNQQKPSHSPPLATAAHPCVR